MAIDKSSIPATATAINIVGVVVRCGCGKKELNLNHQLPDGTWTHLCPSPKSTKRILLAAWRKNPIANFWVNLKIKIQRKGLPWLRS